MSEILSWAFVIFVGGFFVGMMIYMFYMGLKSNKKIPPDDTPNKIITHKT